MAFSLNFYASSPISNYKIVYLSLVRNKQIDFKALQTVLRRFYIIPHQVITRAIKTSPANAHNNINICLSTMIYTFNKFSKYQASKIVHFYILFYSSRPKSKIDPMI